MAVKLHYANRRINLDGELREIYREAGNILNLWIGKAVLYISLLVGGIFFLFWFLINFFVASSFLAGVATTICVLATVNLMAGNMAFAQRALDRSTVDDEAVTSQRVNFDLIAAISYVYGGSSILCLGLMQQFLSLSELYSAMYAYALGALVMSTLARFSGKILSGALRRQSCAMTERSLKAFSLAQFRIDCLAEHALEFFECFLVALVVGAALGSSLSVDSLQNLSNFSPQSTSPEAYQFWYMLSPFVVLVGGFFSSWLGIKLMRLQEGLNYRVLMRNGIVIGSFSSLILTFVWFMAMWMIGNGIVAYIPAFLGSIVGLYLLFSFEFAPAEISNLTISTKLPTRGVWKLIANPLWIIALVMLVAHGVCGSYGLSLATISLVANTYIYLPIILSREVDSSYKDLPLTKPEVLLKNDYELSPILFWSSFFVNLAAFSSLAYMAWQDASGVVDFGISNTLVLVGVLFGLPIPLMSERHIQRGIKRGSRLVGTRLSENGLIDVLSEGDSESVASLILLVHKATLSFLLRYGLSYLSAILGIGFFLGAEILVGLCLGTIFGNLVLGFQIPGIPYSRVGQTNNPEGPASASYLLTLPKIFIVLSTVLLTFF